MRPLFLSLATILILSISASGFDGTRKGFVLGGGLGLGPVASVSVDGYPDLSDDNAGIGMNFLIGYAWDEQNMLVFLRDGVMFNVPGVFGDNVPVIQGFSGAGWYHYFGQMGKSGYITVGLGLQDFTSLDSDYESNDSEFGMLIGGGYEFARHVQIYSSLSFGKTSVLFVDFNHTQLVIGLSAVAF